MFLLIASKLDAVTDFLIKLGIKPIMHLLKISVTITCLRQTYQNYKLSRQKLCTFLEKKVPSLKIKFLCSYHFSKVVG